MQRNSNFFIFLLIVITYSCDVSETETDADEIKENTEKIIEIKQIENSIDKDFIEMISNILEMDTLYLSNHLFLPIEVRGPLDDDSIIIINNSNELMIFFDKFLKEKTICGKYLLSNKDALLGKLCSPRTSKYKNFAKVGNLEFELLDSNWVLTRVYSRVYINKEQGIPPRE